MTRCIEDLGASCERHYLREGRRFFWRTTRLTPFQVLMVEFLLWKTRAETVEKHGRWLVMSAPTPEALLDMSIDVIRDRLRFLGLHERRARLLSRMARILVDEYGGRVLPDASLLLSLPGVGSYVAAATLVFAYGQPYLPLDANVERYLRENVGPVEVSAGDRKYVLREEYLELSRRFFSRVNNPRYAAWGLLDDSRRGSRER